jgi:DNA/RNA-binding domain of Phe-tRNA-synthetase-like protein
MHAIRARFADPPPESIRRMPAALSANLADRLDAVTVDPVIHERWPAYTLLVMVVDGLDRAAISANAALAEERLVSAEAKVRDAGIADWTTHPHIAGWFEAFKGFGLKPKKTSPSAFALIKRVPGGLPRIDPLTDIYNAISIGHVLPIGGEDFARYEGAPVLTVADGSEAFDTMASGEPVIEHPEPGEVIWRDDTGVTCRRWNWRQGVRTRITDETTTVLFILEAIDGMSREELEAAGADLLADLEALSPGIAAGQRLVTA